MKTPTISNLRRIPVAIDPLALLFPPSVYATWIKGHHPHVPSVADLKKFCAQLDAKSKKAIRAQAQPVKALASIFDGAGL